ncbi:MAG: response regulator [Elusimicrobiota bacterium]
MRKKLLIIEDNHTMSRIFKRGLEANYSVVLSSSSTEALELFEKEKGRFDLVICDLVLPDYDGVTLIRMLSERNRNLKFIIISGYLEIDTDSLLNNKRNIPFIQKPFYLSTLRNKISEILMNA